MMTYDKSEIIDLPQPLKQIKALPKVFVKFGYQYRQVIREGNFAIYAQHVIESGKVIAYEVINIKINSRKNGRLKNPFLGEGAELYPPTSQWGVLGYSCFTLKDALKRLSQMKNSTNQEKP